MKLEYQTSPTPRPVRLPNWNLRLNVIVAAFFVAVIGVLFVMPQYHSHDPTGAKISAAKQEISTLNFKLERFKQDFERYPTSAEGLNALVVNPITFASRRAGYIEYVPPDPWGHPYVYHAIDFGESFDLASSGPDGLPGTADDIK